MIVQTLLPFLKDKQGNIIQSELIFPNSNESLSIGKLIINSESFTNLINFKNKLESDLDKGIVPKSCIHSTKSLIEAIYNRISLTETLKNLQK